MQATKGRASPQIVPELLRKQLEALRGSAQD